MIVLRLRNLFSILRPQGVIDRTPLCPAPVGRHALERSSAVIIALALIFLQIVPVVFPETQRRLLCGLEF